MILQDQHCGVIKSSYEDMIDLMPDIKDIVSTFPHNPKDYTWDVKVHMLMPNQYPCIPNWHYDCVPRDVDLNQDFDKVNTDHKMFLYISNAPLTEFKEGGFIKAKEWTEFTQLDLHRGTMSTEFIWRCFIRATDKRICQPKDRNPLRKHCQVYLDTNAFKW